MKYILLLLLLLPSLSAEAATYWVGGSFEELTKTKFNELDSLASQIPNSFMEAKQNNKCFLKYETVKKRLIAFDKERASLKESDLKIARDKYILELDKKFIQLCLKKYGESSVSANPILDSSEYKDLGIRITKLESQIKEIIKVLESVGRWTPLKGH